MTTKNNKARIIVGVLGLPIRKINDQIEYFLTRRHNPQRLEVHNRWQCTGGGLEYGETPEECLIREFQEELDIQPKIIFSHPIINTSIFTKNKVHILLICYIVSIQNQVPKIIDHETNKIGWFTFDQIEKLQHMPNGLDLLKQARKIIEENDIL